MCDLEDELDGDMRRRRLLDEQHRLRAIPSFSETWQRIAGGSGKVLI